MIFGYGVPSVSVETSPLDGFYLDVRDADEWRAGHIPFAHHVPLRRLPYHLGELPRDRTIVCVCRVGARSAQAAAFLTRHGYRAVNLDGGMAAWRAAWRPLVSETELPPAIRLARSFSGDDIDISTR